MKTQSWRKIFKCSICNLSWFRKFTEKEQSCENNPEKSYTEKKAKHKPSGQAMFTKCSFDEKENKLDYCRRKDCIEKLCKKLKKHAMKIIHYEKK